MKKITSTIAMAIMAMTVMTLTSCEDVYISGELTGSDSKIWEGRISTYYEDRWGLTGDDYHTVIQFDSDDFRLTRGRGREIDYDVRNPYGSYWYSEFEWRVDKGVIELRYADTGFAPVYIYEYTLTDNYFSGYMVAGTVTDVDFSNKPAVVTLDDGEKIEADTVIIATGASAKYLGMPDEDKYNGRGVSACATCDGFFYRKKVTAVVGGGDTACEDALYLSQLCSKVYLVVRKPFLRASKIMQERVMAAENIEILFEHNATGLYGENGVEGMHVVKRKGEADEQHYDVAIDGFFLAIGHKPNSDVFRKWVDTDEIGYIRTIGNTQQTRTPGLFVAGDVCDPTYRQAVVAAGTGCKAALEAERYLQTI